MNSGRLFKAGSTSALMIRLLIVGAVLPLASEGIVSFGERHGMYSAGAMTMLHVVVVSVLFSAIALAEGLALRRVEKDRLAAHRLIEESEARLGLQIQRMPSACITLSRDFTVMTWNPAAVRIFGFTEAEIVGTPFSRLLPNGVAEEPRTIGARLSDEDDTAHHISENLTRDGRTIVCSWTRTSLIDPRGEVVGVLAMAEDITEQRRAQAALLQSRSRQRELLDQLPHYIFRLDLNDRYTDANAATCRFFGLPEAQIVGKSPEELGIPPEIAGEWRAQNARTRETGLSQTVEQTTMTLTGPRTCRATTSPVRDLNGAIVGVSGISIDTTELKTAEASANRLLHAVQQLDEVVFTTDRDGTITYVNPAFTRVYGYTRDEAIGKTPRILKGGDLEAAHYQGVWTDLLAGRSVRGEYKNRRRDGSFVDVMASASPVFDDGGNISGFIAVQNDVTSQKRAAEERKRFDERLGHLARMESLGTLAGGIAHDFNNILSIILTHTSLLDRRGGDPAVVARVTSTVRNAVTRGAGLARQILTFARRADVKAEPVNLPELIMELGSMISETFPRTISISMDLDADLPVLSADGGQIHQALLNLCVNARDAMPSGGSLTIQARVESRDSMKRKFVDARADDYVAILVIDTGTGIDEETRKRMFEPFFTTKEKGKGTGLGLALVYGVVNNHGGLIDVSSTLGEGTTFSLYLPLEPCAAATVSSTQGIVVGGTERVLVIEDEPLLLDSVSTQLRDHGYVVRAASNGANALAMVLGADGIPDVVIMDLGMPKMSAQSLLESIRAVSNAVPVIAMTGYLDPEVHAGILSAGVSRIIAKPFEITSLLAELRAVL
jgi:two-component system, cell cycle sensor histidine kinase and response regulator CckA